LPTASAWPTATATATATPPAACTTRQSIQPLPPNQPSHPRSFDEQVHDARKVAIQIPVQDLKVGDIVSSTEYRRISWVSPTLDSFRFVNLRQDSAQREWTVTSSRPYQCCSSQAYTRTVKVNKGEMAKRFMSVHDDVFTVKFLVNFSRDKLAAALAAAQTEVSSMSAFATPRDFNRLADRMLESSERTVVGRLVSSDAALGYSLVDDLGKTNPKADHLTNFLTVNHREILELVVRDVRYVRS